MKKQIKENDIPTPDNGNENTEATKKMFSRKQVVLISVLCAVIVAAVILTVTCVVNDFNPITYVASVVTKDEENLIGIWQSEEAPGISAYVFNEDGTYDSYISSFNFGGEYEVNADKLTLVNPLSDQKVVYRYSVNGDKLTMTLIEENGSKVKNSEPNKYNKSKTLSQKSLTDLLGELKKNQEETTKK